MDGTSPENPQQPEPPKIPQQPHGEQPVKGGSSTERHDQDLRNVIGGNRPLVPEQRLPGGGDELASNRDQEPSGMPEVLQGPEEPEKHGPVRPGAIDDPSAVLPPQRVSPDDEDLADEIKDTQDPDEGGPTQDFKQSLRDRLMSQFPQENTPEVDETPQPNPEEPAPHDQTEPPPPTSGTQDS